MHVNHHHHCNQWYDNVTIMNTCAASTTMTLLQLLCNWQHNGVEGSPTTFTMMTTTTTTTTTMGQHDGVNNNYD